MGRTGKKSYLKKKDNSAPLNLTELIALLIENNHQDAYYYPINFFKICLKQIHENNNKKLYNNIMANRIAMLESEDFSSAINNIEKSFNNRELTEEEKLKQHLANMRGDYAK